ncbi:MAG: serine/threonine-protein kinase [Polyangiaceae bacterium]
MSKNKIEQWSRDPVYVTESIPASGAHEITPEEIERESIPTPKHLRVLKELGRGGMGCIHPATDRHLLRHVALKRLDRRLASEPYYRDGFIAEAQITGQLEHPNIVPVHELALDERDALYFTMKLVIGTSLDRWFLEPEHALGTSARLESGLEILIKVCDAVAYAHHRGVIHRDLKPGNIMIASFGQVYVMDWGLARLTRLAPSYRRRAEVPGMVGTLEYMAPEQASGDPTQMDERADVFGIGAILYELLSGRCPYGHERHGGDQDEELLLERVRAGAVVPIDAVTTGLGASKQIRAIVDRATHPNPNERYQSVLELRDDIAGFLRRGMHLPRKNVPAGTIIIREGDAGDAAFIITSGTCRVYRDVDSEQETLAVLGPGDVFGEMALLLDERRVASVEAVTNVTLLVLDKTTMTEGLGVGGWTGALVRALARRFHDLELKIRSLGVERDKNGVPAPVRLRPAR